jgi:hypothetical protein
MIVPRRHLLQVLTLGAPALAQQQPLPGLSEVRLKALRPVLDRRAAQLKALRAFEVDDAVGPNGRV